MDAVVGAANLRMFSKSLTFLGKLSDELTMQLYRDKLSLTAVNSSRSAFVAFAFYSSFFERLGDGRAPASDRVSLANCKVLTKAVLVAFRGRVDRNAERCELSADLSEGRLAFRVKYRNGMTRTHKLMFEEAQAQRPVFNKDIVDCRIRATPKQFNEWLNNFSSILDEITFAATPEKLQMSNFQDPGAVGRGLQTRLMLTSRDFDHYDVRRDCELTFNLRDLRAFLSFCEILGPGEQVTLHFQETGKPIICEVALAGVLSVQLVLATQIPSTPTTAPIQRTETPVPPMAQPPTARDEEEEYVPSTPPPAQDESQPKRARFG